MSPSENDNHQPLINDDGEIIKAGCVVVDDERVLLVGKVGLTVWGFPKGHAEPYETLEQVAARETLEETGYEVEIVKRLPDGTYNDNEGNPVRLALFEAKITKEVGGGEEHTEWIDIVKARTLIYPNLVPILDGVVN